MEISTAARNAACDAIVDLVDGGAGAGTIQIRTGAAPTAPSDADTGTLLATLTFSDPAFGAASSGVATASAITSDTNVDDTGTAAHYRVKDSNGTVIWQGNVSTSGAAPSAGLAELLATADLADVDDAVLAVVEQILAGELTVDEQLFADTAAEFGMVMRVVERDGEPLMVTEDYRTDRINVVVADGVVVAIDGIG